MSTTSHPTFLCLASHFKGGRFLVEAAGLGVRVLLLTSCRCHAEPWPREACAEIYHMADLSSPEVVKAVSYLARQAPLDAIVPLDEWDVETAAHLREHFRLPGLGDSAARCFRDKLAMRVKAREAGLCQPEFVATFTDSHIAEFVARVPGPWLLKPRSGAGSAGIRRCRDEVELWEALHAVGDERGNYLIEQFVDGDIFHVDSISFAGQVCAAQVHRYDLPPLSVSHSGGVFGTRTVGAGDPVLEPLLFLNRQLLALMGLERGIGHAEFIRCRHTGHPHFLEVAARVGGANIDVLVEQATGLNLWREWARLELAQLRGERYRVPARRSHSAVLLQCLARSEQPDLAGFHAPEVVWRLERANHAGLILAGSDADRICQLSERYRQRLEQEYLAVLPAVSLR